MLMVDSAMTDSAITGGAMTDGAMTDRGTTGRAVADEHFTVSIEDGIATLVLDVAGRSMNVVDEAVLTQLAESIDPLLENPEITGIELVSGKPGSFGGGADLSTLPHLAHDPRTPDILAAAHALMVRMSRSDKPIVAALDGHALGGAFEVALACTAIVATDRAIVGLPESTLGLIPGGGGTQLVLRRTSLADAIDLLVTGRFVQAEDARRLGLVDRVVAADELRTVVRELARSGDVTSAGAFPAPQESEAVAAAVQAVRKPPSAAASAAITEALVTGVRDGMEAGLAEERRQFLELLQGDESAGLIHMFHVETRAKKAFKGTAAPESVAVVGAGMMGGGLASCAAAAGIASVVRDVDQERIDEARTRAEKNAARRGRTADRWTGTTEWVGFADTDVVVEAVFELPELKRETLSTVADMVDPTALITTNTSAIPIASLRDAVAHPERFLGTHFFSPVERMPLVELIPHDGTAPEAVDRAGALGRALGKVPVVVADYPGFYTSRVYARWLLEALRLLLDGASVEQIDTEARAAGFPVGPLQATDEVTLALVGDASFAQVAEVVMAERLDVSSARALLNRLIESGIRGRRFGEGFYSYSDGKRVGVNPRVADVVGTGSGVAAGECGERLLLAFVTECLLCWDDGTLCHPDDGDLAAVLGIGFPRSLGGPFHWVDRRGAKDVIAACERHGSAAFPVGNAVPTHVDSGERFATVERRLAPGRQP